MTEMEKMLSNIHKLHLKEVQELEAKWQKKYQKLEEKIAGIEAAAAEKAERKLTKKLVAAKKILGEISVMN